jgi:two-component system response regulator FixJ
MISESKRATILVIDDDPSIRKALRRLLESAGYGVRTFATAHQFMESKIERAEPACLVLDVKMPGMDGLELQEELLARAETLPIVFITGHGDVPSSVGAMKKGAVDFLPKPFDEWALLEAVQAALRKDSESRAVLRERENIQRRLESLTPREHEVMTYVITGMLNKQIAHALDITEKTVIVHRGRVLEKMGAGSVAELVRLAEKVGVEPADTS